MNAVVQPWGEGSIGNGQKKIWKTIKSQKITLIDTKK